MEPADTLKFNFIQVTDVALAAALTALGCPLYAANAGGNIHRGGKTYKTIVFAGEERTRRMVKFWTSKDSGEAKATLTEAEENLILRYMQHASFNRMEILRSINKGTDLAVIRNKDGTMNLMPCKLKESRSDD